MAIDRVRSAAPPRHGATALESPLPSPLRIGVSRIVPELKMFYRRPEQVVLTFSMPAVIGVLLGSIFSTKLPAQRYQHRRGDRREHSRLRNSLDIIHQPRHQHRCRPGKRSAQTATRDAGDRGVVFRRQNLSGRHRQPGRGGHPAVGGCAGLRTPTTDNWFGWFTLTWVFILGILSCSLLGIFVSNLASNAVSAGGDHQRPGGRLCNSSRAHTFR